MEFSLYLSLFLRDYLSHFGEEKEDKGFIHVELSRGNTKYSFRSINPRPFVTLDLNLINAIIFQIQKLIYKLKVLKVIILINFILI